MMVAWRRVGVVCAVCALLVGSGCGGSLGGDGQRGGNEAPRVVVARGVVRLVAGEALVVQVGEQVTLDVASSSDPDGDPLTFRWTLKDAAGAVVAESQGGVLTFALEVAGTYALEVVASDSKTETAFAASVRAEDEVIMPRNTAPVAAAGADVALVVGEVATLDGSGSADPDGDALSYQWVITRRPDGSAAALAADDQAQVMFTPDVAGAYEVTLTVRDPSDAVDVDVVVVTAAPVDVPVNHPPVASVQAPSTAEVGQVIALSAAGSTDPDGDALTFAWTLARRPQGSAAAIVADDAVMTSFTPDVAGAYEVSLVVSDPGGATSSAAATITVEAVSPQDTCLIISEVLEGAVDALKAVEIYNCGTTTIDVTNAALCQVENQETTCRADSVWRFAQAGLMMQPGAMIVLCTNPFTSQLTPYCHASSPKLSFNGNDRLVLFDDSNANATFDAATDEIHDVFGQIGTRPQLRADSSLAWSDRTYRRCALTPNLGIAPFALTSWFRVLAPDFTGLRQAPPSSEPCDTANAPPAALIQPVAGRLTPGMTVSLDGSRSSDAHGDTLTFAWALLSKPGGSTATLGGSGQLASLTLDAPGSYQVQLTVTDPLGASDTDTLTLTASDGCLFISEYIESGPNKILEITSCHNAPTSLADVRVCTAFGTATTPCENYQELGSLGTIAANQALVICATNVDPALVSRCDLITNYMNFNGDDRVSLVRSSTGEVIDAFGTLLTDITPQEFAADTAYRRCNFTPYDGSGGYSATGVGYFEQNILHTRYTNHPASDTSNLGIPPVQSCP